MSFSVFFSRMPRRFTLSDYLHPDKALWPPEQPPKLALFVYPDHQKRYVPQMLHPFEGSLSFETVVASTQCNMDNISSSVRPLKKGLFLKMGKNFFKIVPPVGNQTYKLYLLYYDSNRNKNFML